MAATEIASALDLPKSTTHHLLNVMRDRRFVSYWPDQRAWTLGVSAFEVGASYMRSGPLHREGQRHMVALTKAADETSHLAVLQGTDVIYLDKREPLKPGVRLVTEVGTRLPAHLTAVGRAILARLDPEQLSALYADTPGPPAPARGRRPSTTCAPCRRPIGNWGTRWSTTRPPTASRASRARSSPGTDVLSPRSVSHT